MKYFYIALIAVVMIVSCGKKEEAAKDPHSGMPMTGMGKEQMLESPKSDIKLEGSVLTFADVKMTVPADWINEEPSSPIRNIQFTSKGDVEFVMAGFYFGNQEEMVEANKQRWEAEYTKIDKSDKKEYAGGKITLILLEGTYKKKPFPMSEEYKETPGYKTLAAIVKTKDGPYFFKAVDIIKAIDNQFSNFDSFLKSYSAK
jgi:hypothetical protein